MRYVIHRLLGISEVIINYGTLLFDIHVKREYI